MNKYIITLLVLFSLSISSQAQILISLLFGDKLNSDKIEFGIDGGFNYSTLTGIESGSYASDFNLGFYFDLKFNNPAWMIHTGVLVKSSVGADDIPHNEIENEDLNELLKDEKYRKEINYFYVPITVKYRFLTLFNVEAGLQAGLRSSVTDIYKYSPPEGGKLTYKLDADHQIKRLDAGILVGIGSKLSKRPKSMQCGVRYYHGLVDIDKLNYTSGVYNSSIYLYCSIPIGAKKKEEKTASLK